VLTDLSTLLRDGGLERLAVGSVAVILATSAWVRARDGMTPEEDVMRALKTSRALAGTPLDRMVRMNGMSRLRGRSGLFEIRCNGVRFYGGRVGRCTALGQVLELLVLAGAEQKSGKTNVDEELLDRVEQDIVALRQCVAKLEREPVVLKSVAGGAGPKKGRKNHDH